MRWGSLILTLILLSMTGVIGFVTVQRVNSSRAQVLHTYKVRSLLKDLRADIGEGHANFDLYQLSRNPDEALQLDQQDTEQEKVVNELLQLTRDNPPQQRRLAALKLLLAQDFVQLRACVTGAKCIASDSSQPDSLAQIYERRRTMSRMLLEMDSIEDDLLTTRLKDWDRLFVRMVATSVGCFALALLLLVYNLRLLLDEIERRRKLEILQQQNTQSYRMLSARILELQDVEHRKIARELHDSVGQYLAAVKINLGQLSRDYINSASPWFPRLSESLELVDRAIGEIRTISHLLHPPLLDELGFHAAARWYVEGFAQRSGMTIDLRLTEVTNRLPREIELALFRVLQESLTNVHRHAKATHVEIDVDCTDDEVILQIQDNGKGITDRVLESFRAGGAGGIGLAGMRERLAELGGTLEVKSGPCGARVRATAPTRECNPSDPPPEKVTLEPV